nr:MAG TPA: hypothetical protein [Caudoviricetes sp.]
MLNFNHFAVHAFYMRPGVTPCGLVFRRSL